MAGFKILMDVTIMVKCRIYDRDGRRYYCLWPDLRSWWASLLLSLVGFMILMDVIVDPDRIYDPWGRRYCGHWSGV